MNQQKIRKIIALCCASSLLALTFISCGSKDDTKDNAATESPSMSPTDSATTAPTDAATNNATNDANNTTNTYADKITGAKGGTYAATEKGYASDVTVTVKISDAGLVESIDVDAGGETENIGQAAAPEICRQVVENQSLNVDTISGATYTSTATLAAIKDALTQAGVDTTAVNK